LKRWVAVVGLLLWGVTSGYAAGGNWVLKKDQHGVQVQQQSSDAAQAITQGAVEVEASLDAVVALLEDASACPRWVYDCKQGRVVESASPAQRLTYLVMDSPLLLEDRDMYIESTTRYQRQAKTITVALRGKEDYDAGQPGRTRVLDLQGAWTFRETKPGHVSVSYQIASDPQITIAASILNDHMVTSVFQTLNGLRKVVKEAKYRDARFSAEEIKAIEVQ
jgi:hypothetical protein